MIPTRTAAHRHEPTAEELREENRTVAHQRFGGINWGAAFFGWLVAIAHGRAARRHRQRRGRRGR